MDIEKVIIIGSGPAGYTAGFYAGRNDLNPLLISGDEPGGQLMSTKEIENFPGFPEGVGGYELMEKMRAQAEKHGTRIVSDKVVKISVKKYPFKVKTLSKKVYKTYSIIIATGATANRLSVPGSDEFWMKGISACAVCDGALPIFRNKHIIVVGGGDTAMEEALFLSKYASKVTIVHRRDKFRASKSLQKRVFSDKKIDVLWDSEIVSINGKMRVETVTVLNKITQEKTNVDCGGLFYAIGHTPNTDFLKSSPVQLDKENYIIVEPGTTKTNINGVFAAGDVQDKIYRQAVTASASGCMSALEVDKYLLM